MALGVIDNVIISFCLIVCGCIGAAVVFKFFGSVCFKI
jgi:hypothetical protein